MSYLLDALRKSEAQRRLGELPTLSTGTAYTASPRRGSRKGLLSVMFALAAALAGFVIWREFLPPLPPQLSQSPRPLAQESRPELPSPLAEESRPASSPSQAGEGQGGGEAEIERETRAAETQRQPRQTTESRQVRRRLVEPAAPGGRDDGGARTTRLPDQEAAAVGRGAAEPDAAEPADDFTPARREFIRQWELPASVRDELPEFNVMAHIYSDNPENRFVLMNGRRYVEGDSLGQGATLAEIRREGAVVDFREYRFLLE